MSFDDFKDAFFDPDKMDSDARASVLDSTDGVVDTNGAANASSGGSAVDTSAIQRHTINELGAACAVKAKDLDDGIIAQFKVKTHVQKHYECLWNSQGSMSHMKVALWKPLLDKALSKRNRKRICLGYYATAGDFNNPNESKQNGLNIEVIDTKRLQLQASDHVDGLLDLVLPHPKGFRQVWCQQRTRRDMYAWRAFPPSDEFVAMGMIVTNTEDEPPVTCMRCVPKVWCKEATMEPEKVWDDTGSSAGGRRGSIWVINSLRLLCVRQGHDPPPASETFWELRSDNFKLNPDNIAKAK